MRYLGAVIWNAIPINTKTVTPFNSFKNRIKSECRADSVKPFSKGLVLLILLNKIFYV